MRCQLPLFVVLVLGLSLPSVGRDLAAEAAKNDQVLKVVAQPLTIDAGKVRGLVGGPNDSVHIYRGIPFAAPPLGDLRWRPPTPPKPWSHVREAYEFGSAAPQRSSPLTANFPGMAIGAPTNEDCLYLNVWTPAKRADKPLPVMVWIHGGGYTIGAGSQRLYEAADLARRDVVVVSVNYRLGALGFLAHPQLTAESEHASSGNYGLLDQIEALRWVQRNIGAFGGDPKNVTIFGESAGGGSVFSLLVSPLAKGLFHRAIAQSGPALNFAHLKKPNYGFTSAEQAGKEYATRVGAPDGPGQLAALRAMNADDLLKGTPGMEESRGFNVRQNLLQTAPTVDGWVIPDDPMTMLAEGRQNQVPLIVGANRDEGTMLTMVAKLPTTLDAWNEQLDKNFGELSSSIRTLYPTQKPSDVRRALTELLGDFVFLAPARFVARTARKSSPVYQYHFAHPPAGSTGQLLGAHHGAEIAYVLDNLEIVPGSLSKSDELVRDTLSAYWVQFAATGDPNRDGLPKWTSYDPATDECLLIENDLKMVKELRKPRLDAIDQFMDGWRKETGVSRP